MSIEAPPTLSSERLTQRLVEERDLPDLFAIHSVDEVNRFLPYTTWKDMADAEAWYGRAVGRHEDGSAMQFVIVENDSSRVVGTSLLFRFDRDNNRCDLGYALGQGWWGRGYMREAVSTLMDHAFGAMALRRIEAEVDPRNASSHGLLLRLGFTHEGRARQRYVTRGEVKDVNAYGLLRDEWVGAKAEARSIPSPVRSPRMPKPPLGKIVATRELDFVRPSGEIELALVMVGEPVQPDGEGPWYCPYQVRTPSFEKSYAIAGEDSMQALILTLHVISSALLSLERQHDGVFKQYGETNLGLPDAANLPS